MKKGARKLHIVADENISGLDSLCGDWATLERMPGREISPAMLQNCDVLLVRSVTTVNKPLLEETPVKFVGSATIGTEHIDTSYLAQRNIAFAAAPGCNANAVVDYVMASIAELVGDFALREKCVGIVGYGNVGSRLYRCLQHFNINCLAYDPFLADRNAHCQATFNELLKADIISVHVPLTRSGPHPTLQMFDDNAFASMADNVLFINSSRGDILDEQSLQQRLALKSAMQVVLDVWQDEPVINSKLLERANLASPHIAGYSLAGKLRGSYAVVKAMCQYFGLPSPLKPALLEAPSFTDHSRLDEYFAELEKQVDIAGLSKQFKASLLGEPSRGGEIFDHYRKNYPLRAEFCYLAGNLNTVEKR